MAFLIFYQALKTSTSAVDLTPLKHLSPKRTRPRFSIASTNLGCSFKFKSKGLCSLFPESPKFSLSPGIGCTIEQRR
jgi:hypothetical protein